MRWNYWPCFPKSAHYSIRSDWGNGTDLWRWTQAAQRTIDDSGTRVPDGRRIASGYSEFGVKPLGIKGYKTGVITPHAAFLALEFAPKECIKNLRKMLELYNAYGEYGFYDAIDIANGKVSVKYLCLDQAMSFIALNNFINDGAIRKRFHADPIAQSAEELLKVEDFFE